MKRRTAIPAALSIAALITAAAVAAAGRDGAVIQNSGSTNAMGYTIKVWSTGDAWWVASNRAGEQRGQASTSRLSSALVEQLLADARRAKAAGAPGGQGCMKSASFGTATKVLYHGWTSSDLECPGNPQLSADTHAIAQALHAGGTPGHMLIRRPLVPNEQRRPQIPAAQPSASPES